MTLERLMGKGRKVKSGCQTCKARKVKCDESYPVCRRCLSSGRVCDGYGIWGGGGNVKKPSRADSTIRTVAPLSPPISVLVASKDEKSYFDWFKCCTSVKLPGSFLSDFWSTLLMQASVNEPAIFHAVLALGSLHRRGILLNQQSNSVPDAQLEQFTLQHYNKSIGHLRHFSTKDKASFRIVLIACIVFVSLDFLRGHFSTAQIHLQNGMKIIEDSQWLLDHGDGSRRPKSDREAIDDWIIEAFSRFQAHVELCRYMHQYERSHLYPLFRVGEGQLWPSFRSLKDAWREMDRLLNRIFHLRQEAHEASTAPSQLPTLLESQKQLQNDITRWLETYRASAEATRGSGMLEEARAYRLLSLCHNLATIMANTCLTTSDETIYDTQTDHFLNLITQLADIKASIPPSQISRNSINMSRSIVDIGWIPPLYYTALKCRVHRIRLQAVRLLECTFHREGMFDSTIAGIVARRVMEVEEGGFYKDFLGNDDFELATYPQFCDLSLPTLPVSHRLGDIETVMSGEPVDKLALFCKKRNGEIECRTFLGEYDMKSQGWVI